jgi:hypothetical protein
MHMIFAKKNNLLPKKLVLIIKIDLQRKSILNKK